MTLAQLQNDHPLHMALTNSADEDTKGKVQGEKSEYTTGAMAPHICDNLGSLGTMASFVIKWRPPLHEENRDAGDDGQ
jgi:hypothetical protein